MTIPKHALRGWLALRGLTLAAEKTRIVHLTEGFDFLGFNVRHYKDTSAKSGYKLLITPSKDSERRIKETLRKEWIRLRGTNVQAVLRALNPLIRGWANYHRINVASRTFRALDNWMFHREVRFLKRIHPSKPASWTRARYFGSMNPRRHDHWVFGDKRTGGYLLKLVWFKIERHILVQGRASPDDPALRAYWAKRMAAQSKDLPPRKQGIARAQNHVCPLCGESIHIGEDLHEHHLYGRGKSDAVILVHLYCHQKVHGTRKDSV